MKISKTNSDPAAIEIDEESQKILNNLLSKFRRCLCKKKADNEVTICFLDDTNSNFYHDGTSSNLTGTEGDVMVYFPEFWYKGDSDSDPDWHILQFSENQPDDSWYHAPASLVGVYKGTISDDKLYSMSGILGSSLDNTEIEDGSFKKYATNRGSGYHIMDYQQHCIIAWMFMSKYKTRDSQTVCGIGPSDELKYYGSTNSLGMTDTTPSTASPYGNTLVNFLGLEACWGNKYEIIEGIHCKTYVLVYDKGDQFGKTFEQISYKNKRKLTPAGNGSYIKSIYLGKYMDLIPSEVNEGSSSTYYCDSSTNMISLPSYETARYISRSFYSNSNFGGVFNIQLFYTSDNNYQNHSIRLAFDGNIIIEDNVQTFKELPVL